MRIFKRQLDWVGGLAAIFGAAVVIPSLIALLITIAAVARELL